MKVRAAARILEKGVQDDLIRQAQDNQEGGAGKITASRGQQSKAPTTTPGLKKYWQPQERMEKDR